MSKPERAPQRRPENKYVQPRMVEDFGKEIEAAPVESKSWDEYEIAVRFMRTKAVEIQNHIDSLVQEWKEFEGQCLKAYKKMPKTDAMFSESPLSPMRFHAAMRANFAKLGWSWAAGLPWGPDKVKRFIDVVEESCKWGDRIVKDDERLLKVEAAKKAAEKASQEVKSIV
jgi:hypothetical protein